MFPITKNSIAYIANYRQLFSPISLVEKIITKIDKKSKENDLEY